MKDAPIPPTDDARLEYLRSLDLLATPAEADFDRIIEIAAEHFKSPIALLSLVDKDRQWFKSRSGLNAAETPRNISFCGHAIAQDDVFVVEDAAKDPRFFDNPLVVGEPKIASYAGVPIKMGDGHNIGTLCIIGHAPRSFSESDRARLRDFRWWMQLALDKRRLSETQRELIAELDEARRESMLDPMTQTWNRRGFADLTKREILKARRANKSMALVMIDIDHFKKINDTYGHPEGDKAIISLARYLRSGSRATDVLARLGGEEFAILMPEVGRSDALRLAESLRSVVETGSSIGGGPHFTISLGVAWIASPSDTTTEEEMVAIADKALYAAKQSGRNRVVASPEAVSPEPPLVAKKQSPGAVPNVPRHSRESGNPFCRKHRPSRQLVCHDPWIPAFAGMTVR